MDILSDILKRFHFKGTLYFRTSFTSPWGVEIPHHSDVMRFHFAHKGRCLVRINGVKDPVALEQGDLLIIPRGASHKMYCDPTTEDVSLPLEQVLAQSGFTGEGALVFGGDDDERDTQLICGHFSFDPHMQHLLFDRLPPYIHLANYGEVAGKWMEYTLRMIGMEAGKNEIGSDIIAAKMSEIILAQALRTFIKREGKALPGLAGFSDQQIAKALAAIHKKPKANWTILKLAEIAGMSRTAFALKFSTLLRKTPMGYLTDWRMQLACHDLKHTQQNVAEIAENIGYASDAAFARTFKKVIGVTPAKFRSQ